MPNPLFSNNTSPNGVTSPNNPLNDSNKRYFRGYNRFNYSRTFYNTERYADINVIDVVEGVEKDILPFGNKHEIRSYTLASPIMFDIYKKKTYFMVDNKAILPNNWEKIYKQPNKGDDVPDDANCLSAGVFAYVRQFFELLRNSEMTKNADNYNYLWRVIFLLESIFSNGSLLSSMNCHLSSSLRIKKDAESNITVSFDKWLETLLKVFTPGENRVPISVHFPSISSTYFTNRTSVAEQFGQIYVSPQQLFDMMRTYPDFVVQYSDSLSAAFDAIIYNLKLITFIYDPDPSGEADFINLSRLMAYQLVCTQFYTNDSVDNIYNAEIYMQNARDIAINAMLMDDTWYKWPQLQYNGTYIDYDVFSCRVIDTILENFFVKKITNNLPYGQLKDCYYYLHMIFFYRKSLRYGDYFVGAKTLPYAPGDVTADVVNGGVSALDMTRSLLMQRFLNSVGRARNTWKDYLKDVTDGIAPPNPLEPRFLASSTSKVGGFEVENTAENQGNIVTLLKSSNSNYIYEVEVGEPCIIIGVSTYEVPRVYSRTIDRFFKHKDRFDMFNKFMQNIGDQEISLGERSSAFSWSRIFGYTPRHMEYKQRYPIASGGFVENLPGYAFITDNNDSGQSDTSYNVEGLQISSFFIRNKNSEMDRFYSSLTGLTLASYFHFIVKYDCLCDAKRQMEFNPTIL